MEISGGLTGAKLSGPTLCAGDSPVSQSALRGRGSRKRTSDGSGRSSGDAFATFDPDTCSWKTCRVSLVGEWETYSETWPASGMTRNGKAYRRRPLVPRTSGTGSSLWPTPNVCGGGNPPGILVRRRNHFVRPSGRKAHLGLDQAVRMWPTPRVSMHKDSTTDRGKCNLGEVVGGQLNPTWVEWLMGFPLGWTDLDALETQ